MTKLRAAALTHIGRVRRTNEDRALMDRERGVFGVADGVGGLPGGAEASQTAHDSILSAVRQVPAGTKPDLEAIVQAANRSVLERGRSVSPSTGIATTLTFGCVFSGSLLIAHLGDSRCYALRRGTFGPITEDHTVESEARRRGQGRALPYSMAERHAITRCLGQPLPPDPHLINRPLEANDRYLFCTDGITGLVSDKEMAAIVARNDEPAPILSEMVNLALKRGGTDNATAVLLIVDEV